jgi:hypothetical protein
MSENEGPLAQPESKKAGDEFDFASSTQPAPRLKRRNLKPKAEPAPSAPAASAPTPGPSPASSHATPAGSTVRPAPTGTGHLYYSTAPRPEKEPMKTTPTTSTPNGSAAPISSTRPATAFRPTTVSDYRSNVERQSREQKSMGNVLAILVYCLIGLFVIATSLAGYGAYVISQQLHQQSVTVAQLDDRFASENQVLTNQLKTTMDTVALEQSDLLKQQELILQQQNTINKLMAANDAAMSAIRDERSDRADEEAGLRARINRLQNELHDAYRP